jgi:hypothetical protein
MTRVRERDLIIPALQAAAARPNGEITMSDLIDVLTGEFRPSGRDAQILDGRQDTYFSQKVRNLVSHRGSPSSMFAKKYATYRPETESIRITPTGRSFLDQVPEE